METVGRVPRSGPAEQRSAGPFTSIESAHEFLALLGETIDEALDEVQQELTACTTRGQQVGAARRQIPPREVDAWRVVLFTTSKLRTHVAASRRLLNDLRTLRNLLHRQQGVPAPPEPVVKTQHANA